MNELTRKTLPDYEGLPNITFRQLEVFRAVSREGSYSNAALELHSTRANVKRVCSDFEKAVGRTLFEEGDARLLLPTPFAQGLLGQVIPLSRGLRRLGETVRSLHESGRILRFAAAGEFFKGGLFTDFLARLQITDSFRPCFLRVETKRFRIALMNAECDVYFGIGISGSDRLDRVHLARIPWKFTGGSGTGAKHPTSPSELPAGKWWVVGGAEDEANAALLEEFHQAGAKKGRLLPEGEKLSPGKGEWILSPDQTAAPVDPVWPTHRFSAVLRKLHPYSELLPRLNGAALD